MLWLKGNIENIKGTSKKIFLPYIDLEDKIREVKNRKRFDIDSRKALIYIIEQLRAQGYSDREIASKINVGRSTIYRLTHY